MTKKEKEKLLKQAIEIRGRRRYRYVNKAEIDKMAELDRKRSLSGKTIRVYSSDGFVPHSYKYSCSIDFVHRYYDDNGNKHFEIGQTSASRRFGQSALITVNNRGY